jgi:hypothetical protein
MINTLYQKQRSSLAHHYFLEFIVEFTKKKTTNNKKPKKKMKNTNIYIYIYIYIRSSFSVYFFRFQSNL